MTPEELERLKAIEQAATQVTFEIRESDKFGTRVSTSWIKEKLDKALNGGAKPKNDPSRCVICGQPK